MRETKFRGRISVSLTGDAEMDWLYGNLVEELSTKRMFIIDLCRFDEGTTFEEIALEVDPETVGQYTGLKDKKSVEIYEGDIVLAQSNVNSGSCHPTEGKGVVQFNKQMASFMIKIYNNANFKLKLFDTCTYVEGLNVDCEVIGNKHDSPELLEKQ